MTDHTAEPVPSTPRCPAVYPSKSRDPNTRIVHCQLPAGHDGDHEETDTESTWPVEPLAQGGIVTPDAQPPTVLRFRSASGRTEIARRPDGSMALSVLNGSDRLTGDDIDRAIWALSGEDLLPTRTPLTAEEAEAFKARFLEALAHPQRLIVMPPTEDERERAAYERGKAEGIAGERRQALDGDSDVVLPDGTHRYWSTHCRHGGHDACSATSMVRDRATGGPSDAAPRPVEVLKAPAQCKTCAAPCVCACHQGAPDAH